MDRRYDYGNLYNTPPPPQRAPPPFGANSAAASNDANVVPPPPPPPPLFFPSQGYQTHQQNLPQFTPPPTQVVPPPSQFMHMFPPQQSYLTPAIPTPYESTNSFQYSCPPPSTDVQQFNSGINIRPVTPYINQQSSQNIPSVTRPSSAVTENGDRHWIKSWLKGIGKENLDKQRGSSPNPSTSGHPVKICEMKEKMVEISRLLSELESLSRSLSVVHKSLDDEQWAFRCEEIETKKKQLSSILGEFSSDKTILLDVKRMLGKRRKKREREKRRRAEKKAECNERHARREQLNLKIDSWLEDMQDAVERGRREEEMKREADTVLADVTKKKAEAKRQIALLEALLKLRQARVVSQNAIGHAVSQQQTDAFRNVVEHLKELWTKHLDGYLMEERGLKVMLNVAAAEGKSAQAVRDKAIVKQWEAALFGKEGGIRNSEYQPKDFDMLVSVRKDWDKFVIPEGSIMSSSIPAGWVLPVKPSDDDWSQMLSTQNVQKQ